MNQDYFPLYHAWVWFYLKNNIKFEELYINEKSPYDCEINNLRFLEICNKERIAAGKYGISLIKIIWKFISLRVWIASFFYLCGIIIHLCGPVFFFHIVNDTNDKKYSVGGFILLEFVSCIFYSISISISLGSACKLHSACLSSAYNKILKSSVVNRISIYELEEIITGDGRDIYDFVLQLPHLISAPVTFLICLTVIFYKVGINGILAGASFFLYYPIVMIMNTLLKKINKKRNSYTSNRLNIFEEFLTNITMTKLTNWDEILINDIKRMRKKEIKYLKEKSFIHFCGYILLQSQPFVTTSIFCLISIYSEKKLEIFITRDQHNRFMEPILIVFLILMIHLKLSFENLFLGVQKVCNGISILNKLKVFFLLAEIDKMDIKVSTIDLAIIIERGTFIWEKSNFKNKKKHKTSLPVTPPYSLSNIDFKLPKGKLIGICGLPKSGKSSFLLAILGHMKKTNGHLIVNNSISYVSQQPWLFDGTIKDNIIFDEPYDQKRYFNVQNSCFSIEDIFMLPAAENTMIGSFPLTLGQKQIINLCRAAYAKGEILLLDRPLEALDAKTSIQIFENCILNFLKHKSIILVTEKINFLNNCDFIYYMENGQIVEKGTHEELLSQEGHYTNLLKLLMKQNSKKYLGESQDVFGSTNECLLYANVTNDSSNANNTSIPVKIKYTASSENSLDNSESITLWKHDVPLTTNNILFFKNTFPRAMFSTIIITIMFTFFISFTSIMFIKIVYLRENKVILKKDTLLGFVDKFLTYDYVATLYFGVSFVIFFFGLISIVIYNKILFKIAKQYHDEWLLNLYSASVEFIQKLDVSHLLNHFSIDLHSIDVDLPEHLFPVIYNFFVIIFSTFLVVYATNAFMLITIAIFFAIAVAIDVYTKKSIEHWHEEEFKVRRPICTLISNTIDGRAVIQANMKTECLLTRYYKNCNQKINIGIITFGIKYFLYFTNNLLTVLLVSITGVFIIFTNQKLGYACLALVSTLQLCISFREIILHLFECRRAIQTIMRADSFISNIGDEDTTLRYLNMNEQNYDISFKNIRLKFYSDMFVLKNFSLCIKTGEKLGIVGSAASGKKCIIAGLFRLVLPSNGTISIGDIDINDLELKTIRSHLAIVPQEPVMFLGTIRDNLDPGKEFTDEKINVAIIAVCLFEHITKLPKKLDSPASCLTDVGHQQLLYLARAYLRQVKILIIEESMADIGNTTEKVLKQTVHKLFQHSTVIFIASQVQFLEYCEKIVILEKGKIIEILDNIKKGSSKAYTLPVTSSSKTEMF